MSDDPVAVLELPAAQVGHAVRVEVKGPVGSGKSDLVHEIYAALLRQGITPLVPSDVLLEIRRGLHESPHRRVQRLLAHNPRVSLEELTPYQELSKMPEAFRAVAEQIARGTPGQDTIHMFRRSIHLMRGVLDEVESWDIMK